MTTSKVAASLPWWASSAAYSSASYSSAWSRRASSSSVSAGGGYSTCLAGALPRALELTPSSATRPLGPPAQMPAVASISRRWRRRLFRRQNSGGGRLPHAHLSVCLLNIFFHWPLHRPPLLLRLHLILARSRPGLFVNLECVGHALPRDNLFHIPVAAEPSTIRAPPVRLAIWISAGTGRQWDEEPLLPGEFASRVFTCGQDRS